MPRWYVVWVAALIVWAVFVGTEDVWQHVTGHTFWPVRG